MTTNLFGAYPEDRTMVFIDGRSAFLAAVAAGFDINYIKVSEYLTKTTQFVRGYFYTVIDPARADLNAGLEKLLDALEFDRYEIITRQAREVEGKRSRGTTDIVMALDMFRFATDIDHAIVFTGNGEFTPVVELMKQKGVRVTVVSVYQGDTIILSEDLHRVSDVTIDHEALREEFFHRDRPAHERRRLLADRNGVGGGYDR